MYDETSVDLPTYLYVSPKHININKIVVYIAYVRSDPNLELPELKNLDTIDLTEMTMK